LFALGEETYLCFVAAPDLDHLVQLNQRAGIGNDHVVEGRSRAVRIHTRL